MGSTHDYAKPAVGPNSKRQSSVTSRIRPLGRLVDWDPVANNARAKVGGRPRFMRNLGRSFKSLIAAAGKRL
jgi:hypothetical protein